MIEMTTPALAAHPFLRGMRHEHLELLAGGASDVEFTAGHRLFEDGGYAAKFWLIQSGHVALDMYMPGQRPVVIDTVGIGGLLGCSWLFPPYRWAFGAVCVSTVRAFEFDATAVRAACAADPEFGNEVTQRLIRVLASRLQSTRTRLLATSRGAASAY